MTVGVDANAGAGCATTPVTASSAAANTAMPCLKLDVVALPESETNGDNFQDLSTGLFRQSRGAPRELEKTVV
jgi:hypothetical protein